jgi:hypothetical protein
MAYRSTFRRLTEQRVISTLLGCAALILATSTLCEGVIIAGMANPEPAGLDLTGADARTATAHCGAFDVVVIGHDLASASDAQKAALAYLDDHCDYQRGAPAKL